MVQEVWVDYRKHFYMFFANTNIISIICMKYTPNSTPKEMPKKIMKKDIQNGDESENPVLL